MPVIAISNQKGGVGKTTITFNLAKGLAKKGYHVLAVDNDPQGNLTGAFLEDPTTLKADILRLYEDEPVTPQPLENNLSLIGANILLSKVAEGNFDLIYKMKESLEGEKAKYDFILIDCLPSFGYLNMAALNFADHVLIPTKPAPFALMGLKELFLTVEKAQKRLNKDLKVLGIVLNLMESRPTIGRELEEMLRATYADIVFTTKIFKGTKLEESPFFNQSIQEYDPQGKPASQFNTFLQEFLQRLNL